MTSIELVKSIHDRAITASAKTIWVSEKQESFLFSLLDKEGRTPKEFTRIFIATILPSGEWVNNLTYGEAIKIGDENLKRVYIVKPPHYIRREGFNTKKIIIL